MILATKSFTQDEQIAFADYSGDYNPIHLDPLSARRTQIGRQIVHGMNAFLWALDAVAGSDIDFTRFITLKVDFRKPIYVGEPLVVVIVNRSATKLKVDLCADEVVLATILLDVAANPDREISHRETIDGPRSPLETVAQGMEKIQRCSGTLPLSVAASPAPSIEAQYRNAVSWLGLPRFRGIAALSRLVGMECPGLHSLFLSAELVLVQADGADNLAFAVREVDERFQIVRIATKSSALAGIVTARIRAKPVAQPLFSEVAAYVLPGEFAGQTPLIIGGSRGLGELTAKIYAAGGARPIISYVAGQTDAERVADEIAQGGGYASVIKYDATAPSEAQLTQLRATPRQLYYFATARIARRKHELFERTLLDDFLKSYVSGFYELCRALGKNYSPSLSVFYPSTTYIEQSPRGMTEYVMAKLAGEALCRDITRYDRSIKILVRRLPPLLTDQTSVVSNVGSSEQAIETLLPIVREIARMGEEPKDPA